MTQYSIIHRPTAITAFLACVTTITTISVFSPGPTAAFAFHRALAPSSIAQITRHVNTHRKLKPRIHQILFTQQSMRLNEKRIFPSICSPLKSFASVDSNDTTHNPSLEDPFTTSYSTAMEIRAQHGHHAALPHFKYLLSNSHTQHLPSNNANQESNIVDTSAASRIAACTNSLQLLDRIGRPYENSIQDIERLNHILTLSHYHHSAIRKYIFNLPTGNIGNIRREPSNENTGSNFDVSFEDWKNNYPMGPTYARPLVAGQGVNVWKLIGGNSHLGDGETMNGWLSSLQCLSVLFLLSSSVPKSLFLRTVIGGEDTLDLLLRLGIVFLFDLTKELGDWGDRSSGRANAGVNETENEWIVPLAHLFPLELPPLIPSQNSNGTYSDGGGKTRSLTLMTDLHPSVLGLTSIPTTESRLTEKQRGTNSSNNVGGEEEGTVMYIGPDSLALVQHLHASFSEYLESRGVTARAHRRRGGDVSDAAMKAPSELAILDLCTGSGVQALATLAMLDLAKNSGLEACLEAGLAVAVDVNERALRFTKFNAKLNGFEVVDPSIPLSSDNSTGKSKPGRMKVCTVQGDLLSGKVNDERGTHNNSLVDILNGLLSPIGSALHQDEVHPTKYDIILANPPFIPVPELMSDNPALSLRTPETNNNSKSQPNSPRYGLFSSGGVSGEDCLRAIIEIAPSVLRLDGGLLAVVSEYMNPPSPMKPTGQPDVCSKMEEWWRTSFLPSDASCSSATTREKLIAEGILFTNEHALSADVYAERRSFSTNQEDRSVWLNHLNKWGIHSVSPGLLFLHCKEVKSPSGKDVREETDSVGSSTSADRDASTTISIEQNVQCNDGIRIPFNLWHKFVPKTSNGSVWSPHNYEVVAFTKETLKKLFQ